jgi:prepilin-type N-terminal cleavage/methylation domain-containing protein
MMPSPARRHAQTGDGGFTLLEISIALAILGMGVFILLQSQYMSLDLFSTVNDQVSRDFVVDQAVALAELDILSGNDKGDGDLGDVYPDYTYAYETEFIDDVALPGLMEVTLQVNGPGVEEELTFRVYDGVQIDQL